ncbi:MAG: hypothetical protein ABI282_09695, partial [Candidatus Baltobacteraceae bacterium]
SVDTMLNHLDEIAKGLRDEPAPPGSSADAALASARDGRTSVMARLTAAYANGEDSVSRPGALRENLDGALTSLQSFPVQGIVTPAAEEFYARIDTEYRTARDAYNAYVRAIPKLNEKLTSAGLRALPTIPIEP